MTNDRLATLVLAFALTVLTIFYGAKVEKLERDVAVLEESDSRQIAVLEDAVDVMKLQQENYEQMVEACSGEGGCKVEGDGDA